MRPAAYRATDASIHVHVPAAGHWHELHSKEDRVAATHYRARELDAELWSGSLLLPLLALGRFFPMQASANPMRMRMLLPTKACHP